MAKFCRETDSCRKVRSIQNFWFQQPYQVPIVVTQKLLTVWSQKMNHQKAERVTYRVGIRIFRSFWLAKSPKFNFHPAVVPSRTDFSGVVYAQNSVTSKPLGGWGWISSWQKSGRVIYIFCIQLRWGIPTEQPQVLFSFAAAFCPEMQFLATPSSSVNHNS
jgi:hypothetical protein